MHQGAIFFSLYLLLSVFPAHAVDESLIKDVEALRNSLSLKESQRRTLGLRLADLFFDGATDLGRLLEPTDADGKKLALYRRRAISLYEEALSGADSFPPPSGTLKLNIQFQLARLFTDSGLENKAAPLWLALVEQNELADLKREAALRLAEAAEKKKTKEAVGEAEKYYTLAISLCAASDLCSYGYYRRAWLYKNRGQLSLAITDIKQALFDSKNQVREEALRDYLVFLGAENSDGKETLVQIEELAGKLSRPLLFQELSSAFFSAGNRQAGTHVLEYVNSRTPQLKFQVRLMEELYGLRQWEKFQEIRQQALSQVGTLEANDAVQVETTLRRLTVQLDGERISQPALAVDFRETVDLYLKIFPTHKERFKMIEGWLASESDAAKKAEQLKVWLKNPLLGLTREEQIKLREFRVANARKAKDNQIIIQELTELIELAKDPKTAREYRFNLAVAYFEEKRFPDAMPLLTSLAINSGDPDHFTVKSRFLILDILGQEKKYEALVSLVDDWLKFSEGIKSPSEDLKKGLVEWKGTRDEAEFELAASQGQSAPALGTFTRYCLAKRYFPKSCENAKVLAIQLKDQETLLTLLKTMNLSDELAAEYEASGYFAEAAGILAQKLPKKVTESAPYLKLALLYELGERNDQRDKTLRLLLPSLALRKDFGNEEGLLFQTFKEAGLLDLKSWRLPWGLSTRLQIAELLEAKGMGNAETKKLLVGSKEFVGSEWSKLVLSKLSSLDEIQRKQKFYGSGSQRKFENRLAKLKTFINESETYYKGADATTRVEIARLMEKAQGDLASEILTTPIPEGLDETAMTEINGALQKMADPFQARAKEYALLYSETAQVASTPVPVSPKAPSSILSEFQKTKPIVSKEIFQTALTTLHRDPTALGALSEIQQFYAEKGEARLASYFQGRIQSLEKAKETP